MPARHCDARIVAKYAFAPQSATTHTVCHGLAINARASARALVDEFSDTLDSFTCQNAPANSPDWTHAAAIRIYEILADPETIADCMMHQPVARALAFAFRSVIPTGAARFFRRAFFARRAAQWRDQGRM